MNEFFCFRLFCFEPKYHNVDYMKISNRIKMHIKASLDTLTMNDDERTLIALLLKMYETLDGERRIRKSLLQFRNELDYVKQQMASDSMHARLIELSIKNVMLLHYATFVCTRAAQFDARLSMLKADYDYFKKLARGILSPSELFYLRVLYKMPRLMKIKRGFKKLERKMSESIEDED